MDKESESVGSAGGCSSMVELQPSKLITWVRFPSPAPVERSFAHIAQLVEHFLGKEEVTGSSPVVGSSGVNLFYRG
jgi:hypothetical protein